MTVAALSHRTEVAAAALCGPLVEHLRLVIDGSSFHGVTALQDFTANAVLHVDAGDLLEREWERARLLRHHLGRGRPSHFCGAVA